MPRPDFSILIVNWNTRDLTLACIRSVKERNRHSLYEIVLVDNGSDDGTVEAVRARFPDVRIIENVENVGFSRANNQGIQTARGELILLLNSDTFLDSEEPLQRLWDYFSKNARAGIAGATLVLPNGTFQAAGRSFLSVKNLVKQQLLFSSAPAFKKAPSDRRTPYSVDYVDGAFLCIRQRVIDEIGPLNEDYFMYGEDMEWCARARNHGWDVVVLPDIRVIHHHAASTKQNFRKALVENMLNVSRFLGRTHGTKAAKQAFEVYMLGTLLRIPLSALRRNGLWRDYAGAFRDAWKARTRLKNSFRGKST